MIRPPQFYSVSVLKDNIEYMKTFEDGFFDLAIADPPYGMNQGTWKHEDIPWDRQRPGTEYFYQLRRVSKNQIIWGGNFFADLLPPSPGWIVWDKVNDGSHQSDCELAWTSFDCGIRQIEYMWRGWMQGKSIKNGRVARGDKRKNEKRIHPTQKPILLYRWLLQEYSAPGQKVFDSNMGSQSFRIAALEEGVHFWGCENDQKHFQDGNRRFSKFYYQTMGEFFVKQIKDFKHD